MIAVRGLFLLWGDRRMKIAGDVAIDAGRTSYSAPFHSNQLEMKAFGRGAPQVNALDTKGALKVRLGTVCGG